MTARHHGSAVAMTGAHGLRLVGAPAQWFVPVEQRAVCDRSDQERVVDFANWPLYIDADPADPGVHPTLSEFTRRTGITVRYSEDINGDDELFGRVGPRLAAQRPAGGDLVVPGHATCARFIRSGWVQELDRAALPNVARYLDPRLADPPFDPGRRYSVPWQSGITGIAYDRERLGREIRSVSDLWAADLRGRVTLLASLDDAVSLLLLGRGADPESFTAEDFHGVVEQLASLLAAGHIRRFSGNDYVRDLLSGEALACQAWSGDIRQLQAANPGISFVVPEEGGQLWSDSLVVLCCAPHKANAESLIDYYYEPEAAAALAAGVRFLCPVPAAREVLASSKEPGKAALAEDPLVFPDGIGERLRTMRDPLPEERPGFEEAWNAVVGLRLY